MKQFFNRLFLYVFTVLFYGAGYVLRFVLWFAYKTGLWDGKK